VANTLRTSSTTTQAVQDEGIFSGELTTASPAGEHRFPPAVSAVGETEIMGTVSGEERGASSCSYLLWRLPPLSKGFWSERVETHATPAPISK
jgi:hypothetical protein